MAPSPTSWQTPHFHPTHSPQRRATRPPARITSHRCTHEAAPPSPPASISGYAKTRSSLPRGPGTSSPAPGPSPYAPTPMSCSSPAHSRRRLAASGSKRASPGPKPPLANAFTSRYARPTRPPRPTRYVPSTHLAGWPSPKIRPRCWAWSQPPLMGSTCWNGAPPHSPKCRSTITTTRLRSNEAGGTTCCPRRGEAIWTWSTTSPFWDMPTQVWPRRRRANWSGSTPTRDSTTRWWSSSANDLPSCCRIPSTPYSWSTPVRRPATSHCGWRWRPPAGAMSSRSARRITAGPTPPTRYPRRPRTTPTR